MVSAKQRAARAKFARIMRSGGFKKRKSSRRKVNKTRTVIHTMARRRRITRSFRKGGRARGMLGSAKGLFQSAAAGVGGSMVAKEIANRAFPAAAPIAGIGGAYIAGGVKGVIASVAYDAITGQGGILGMFGGSQQSGGDTL